MTVVILAPLALLAYVAGGVCLYRGIHGKRFRVVTLLTVVLSQLGVFAFLAGIRLIFVVRGDPQSGYPVTSLLFAGLGWAYYWLLVAWALARCEWFLPKARPLVVLIAVQPVLGWGLVIIGLAVAESVQWYAVNFRDFSWEVVLLVGSLWLVSGSVTAFVFHRRAWARYVLEFNVGWLQRGTPLWRRR